MPYSSKNSILSAVIGLYGDYGGREDIEKNRLAQVEEKHDRDFWGIIIAKLEFDGLRVKARRIKEWDHARLD
jgi:hypothetical protein